MRWRRGDVRWGCACVLWLVAASASQADAERVQRQLEPRAVVATLPADPVRAAHVARLEATTGGVWSLRWDARTGLAARGAGGDGRGTGRATPATIATAASRFAAAYADLLGTRNAMLRQTRLEAAGRAWHVTWQQYAGDRRVLGSGLDLTLAESGRVVAFTSTLVPDLVIEGTHAGIVFERSGVADLLAPGARVAHDEVVVAIVPSAGGYRGLAAREWIVHAGHAERWRAVVAHDGEILVLENLVRTRVSGQATILAQPAYSDDASGVFGARWVEVHLGSGEDAPSTFADADGSFTFGDQEVPVTLHAALSGRFATVDNETADPTPRFEMETSHASGVAFQLGARWSRPEERTIYHHMNVVHDFARETFGFTGLDSPLPAVANARDPATGDPNYPNAYWNGVRLGFGTGGRTFFNMGLFRDVIYHEYGHAITDHIYRPVGGLVGHVGDAIDEALADYYAVTLTDDPRLGERLLRNGSPWLRNLDNHLVWPDDQNPSDEHVTGAILGGVFWDLRRSLGAEVADLLVHFACRLLPQEFEAYMDAMLVQDDLIFGDAYAGNGSPHRGVILTAFGQHGIGPLGVRRVQIVHAALGDTEDETVTRVVRAALVSIFPDRPQFMRLYHSTGGAFTGTWMTRLADGSFVGTLPAQPFGTHVRYYLGAAQQEPIIVATLPAEAPAAAFEYDVGPDGDPPRIEHTLLQEVASVSWPPQLEARVADNVGVASVFADSWLNGEPSARLGFVPPEPGSSLWIGAFPNVGGQPGDVVEYVITAIDASATGHVTRLPEQGRARFVITDLASNTFESPDGLWQHEALVAAHADVWHVTQSDNRTPGGAAAWLCGDATSGYPARTAAALRTPWYRLGAGARCSIWSRMAARAQADLAIDGGRIEIQVEGDPAWSVLPPASGYTHSVDASVAFSILPPGAACLSGIDAAWMPLEFDLSAWAGQRVRLRFVFGSDAVSPQPEFSGWLLDDFQLDPGTPSPTDAPASDQPRRLLRAPPSPNPFNPRITFRLQVPANAGIVRLDVVDASGRVVRRLVDGRMPVGPYELAWDGADGLGLASPSGVYYYRLESVLGVESGKLVLVR